MRGRHLLSSFQHFSLFILLFIALGLHSQVISVSDQEGNTLPGVEVFTSDLSFGSVTDLDGIITLENINSETDIHFRYLGYIEIITNLAILQQSDYKVKLKVNDQLIDEVVVLGRKTVAQSEIPFQIKTIDVTDIQATNAQTSADALAQHGGVYVQKSQMGGGSPVIRGFEANRVLLVVDDIRLNNAIYRSGHLQNAITVDQAVLDRMEIIFGPNSLIYGSDALGGVVNFKTRNPKLSLSSDKKNLETNYYVRFASANNEKSTHADFSYGSQKWGSLTSVTYSDYGDLRSGGRRDDRFPDFGKRLQYQSLDNSGNDISVINEDENRQIGTGYEQIDVLQKFLFTPNTDHRFAANFQFSTSSNVPRYDNLSELINGQLRWAEWSYGPQKRLLAALDYRHLKSTTFYDQAIVIVSTQRIDEDRISRRFDNPLRTTQREDVKVYSTTLDLSKNLGHQNLWSFDYGADIQHNNVMSSATGLNTSTGVNEDVLTRYASESNTLTNTGAYLYLKGKSSNERLNINGGIRYARSSYGLKYDTNDPVAWPSDFYEGINSSNDAITWSIGGTYRVSKALQLRSMVSTAFRSPNIDDLSKIRVNSSEITFPNLNLKPEKSSNLELTLAFKPSRQLDLSITGFYTNLRDAIVRKDFTTPSGENTWITQGDTLSVVGNINAQEGEIKGISINLSGQITEQIYWYGSINLTSGKEILNSGETTPLAHIAPTYGKVGIDYKSGPIELKGVIRFNEGKALEAYGGSADNPDLASPIGALPWSTTNVYSSYSFNERYRLSLAVENIFDLHYRPFASGLSAPGINIIASFRGSF